MAVDLRMATLYTMMRQMHPSRRGALMMMAGHVVVMVGRPVLHAPDVWMSVSGKIERFPVD